MKRQTTPLICLSVCASLILQGCGGGDYTAYTAAKMKQVELEQNEKPILSMSYTDSGGKPVTMVINLPKQRVEIEQQRSNEWAGVVGGIASTVAPWIGVGVLAHEMSGMGSSTVSTGGGNISGSMNTQHTGTNANIAPDVKVVDPVVVQPEVVVPEGMTLAQ